MRIDLHVIVIGAGLTGSFFLKEMAAYLHMKKENVICTSLTVFDPEMVKKEDLGAVYIQDDLGQNRGLLIAELLKEQYDYEITAVPEDFSEKSPVLRITNLDYVLMVDCTDGRKQRRYRSGWKRLPGKKKLYFQIGKKSLFVDDGTGSQAMMKWKKEKEDFAWEHVRRMFLVNLAMAKITVIYEVGKISYGMFYVDEKKAKVGRKEQIEENIPPILNKKVQESYHYQLVVVGTGGTGSYYLKELGAILSNLNAAENITYSLAIIDGDRVEHKNLDRQNFLKEDIGQHKALVLAEALREQYGIEVKAYPVYIDSAKQLEMVFKQMPKPFYRRSIPVLIGSVDNHRARQEMEKWFRRVETCVWIDAANEFQTGEVVAAVKKNGIMVSPSRPYYFPEIMRSREKRASELSCGVINQSSPQHRFTNMAAAMLTLSATVGILKNGFLPYKIVYFDAFKGTFIPVNTGDERGIFLEDCK